MIFGLLPLVVLGAIVAFVVRAIGGRDDGEDVSTGVAVRRFFQYGLLYAVVVVVAIGLAGLIEQILPAGGAVIRDDRVGLARSLAFVIVGLPVGVGLFLWVRRQMREDPAEGRSFAWSVYLSVASVTALLVAVWGLIETFAWAVGTIEFKPSALSALLVWGPVWAVHWVVGTVHGDALRLRFERVVGSAIGLSLLVTGVGILISVVLREGYDTLAGTSLISAEASEVARAAALVFAGGLIWWWYWLRTALPAEHSLSRHAYLVLAGVLAGLVAFTAAGAGAAYEILVWFIGDPGTQSAASHFSGLPALIATAAVGVGSWMYHRAVLRSEHAATRGEIDRVHDYLVAGVGLIAAATGVTLVVVALFEGLSASEIVRAGSSARNTLLAAITSIAVGGPIWLLFWRRIQAVLETDERAPELLSTSRRVYLFSLFGVGGVVALVSLLVMAFVVIEDIIEGRLGSATTDDIRIAAALIVTTGALAAYHWQIQRQDRALGPVEPVRPRVRDVVVLGAEGAALASVIRRELGATVQVWHRIQGNVRDFDHGRVLAALRTSEHEHVLVLANAEDIQVIPFDRTR